MIFLRIFDIIDIESEGNEMYYKEFINFLIEFYGNVPRFYIYENEEENEIIYEPTPFLKFDFSKNF